MKDPDICIYHGHIEYPATHLVRITCPTCGYFRVAGVCKECYQGIGTNLKSRGTWACPNEKCITNGSRTRVQYKDYWAQMGKA